MNFAENILDYRDVINSAQVLVNLHGNAAWYVADKRSLDCHEYGDEQEAAAWYHIKLVIAEMDKKSQLSDQEIQ